MHNSVGSFVAVLILIALVCFVTYRIARNKGSSGSTGSGTGAGSGTGSTSRTGKQQRK